MVAVIDPVAVSGTNSVPPGNVEMVNSVALLIVFT